jgi:hypothetical protein
MAQLGKDEYVLVYPMLYSSLYVMEVDLMLSEKKTGNPM